MGRGLGAAVLPPVPQAGALLPAQAALHRGQLEVEVRTEEVGPVGRGPEGGPAVHQLPPLSPGLQLGLDGQHEDEAGGTELLPAFQPVRPAGRAVHSPHLTRTTDNSRPATFCTCLTNPTQTSTKLRIETPTKVPFCTGFSQLYTFLIS